MIVLDQDPQTELVAQLSQEFYANDIFLSIVKNLSKLDFEVSNQNYNAEFEITFLIQDIVQPNIRGIKFIVGEKYAPKISGL